MLSYNFEMSSALASTIKALKKATCADIGSSSTNERMNAAYAALYAAHRDVEACYLVFGVRAENSRVIQN